MMLHDNDFYSKPACYREKILSLFHLVVSPNIFSFSPLQTEAHSHEHADFYISLLLSNIQALLVPNSQRTFFLHENPHPGHILSSWTHHHSCHPALSHLSSEAAWPVLHAFFSAEVPALKTRARSTHHHINMLQSSPHSPQTALLCR